MATNTYDPVTLISNWSEDRAAPLANGGVIADYGNRQYSTVSRDSQLPVRTDENNQSNNNKMMMSRPQMLMKAARLNNGDPYTMKGMQYWEDANKRRETAETKV